MKKVATVLEDVLISRFGVKAATSDTSAAPMASRSCVSKEMTELGLGASRSAAAEEPVTTISSTPAKGSLPVESCAFARPPKAITSKHASA